MNVPALVISFGLLIVAMSIHEFSHGWVAYKLGDPTAKYSGRLTLNPLAHIDPIGTVVLPLVLFIATQGQFVFGAAKPVPINYMALRNPKRDIVWIGASGPAANILCVAVLSVAMRFLNHSPLTDFLLRQFIYVNAVLGVFNLVPVPPLDGSRIVMGLLPEHLAYQYSRIEPYGFLVLIALIGLGFFDMLVMPMVGLLLRLLAVPL